MNAHPLNRPVPLLLLGLLAFAAPAFPASDAPVTSPFEIIRESTETAGPSSSGPAISFDLDPAGVTGLRKAGRGDVTLPVPGLGDIPLRLERIHVLSPRAGLFATGDGGAAPYSTDLMIFRGTSEETPGTWAVLGLSKDRLVGSIYTEQGSWAILTPELSPQNNGRHLIWDEGNSTPALDAICGVDDDAARWPDMQDLRQRAEARAVTSADRLVCRIALDADNDIYAGTFGSDLGATTNYLLTLMATVSAMYERDVNVTLEVVYLSVWTTVNDPYTQADPGAQLGQFQQYWNVNHTAIERDDAFLFSGRSYGGVAGIAYLDALCTTFGYGMGSIPQASGGFPTNQVVFNAILTAHEIGHNFGSPHTHSCFWQDNGYAPAGALLDTCAAAEGNCNNAAPHTAYGKGTIMSYCQLQGPVSQTLRSDFHPACISVMRLGAEASCIPVATVQPPTALAIIADPGGSTLTWTPSVTSGVIRYDVYASVFPLDYNPPLLGSTTMTSYAPLPTGTYYFKVKAVRTSDASGFSDEAKGSSCSFDELSSTANLPREMATADFNEDDILDLAVVTGSPGVISILIGQGTAGVGNGTFAIDSTYSAGPNPTAIAVADFNEDGILDLAITSWATVSNSNGTLRLLLGQGTGGVGNGNFTTGNFYTTGKDPSYVVTGDFNEDGTTDVAVAGGFPGKVSVFPGLGANGVGNASFGTSAAYLFLANPPKGLVTGDFNNDDITDIMVAHRGPGSDTEARGVILMGQGTAGAGNGLFSEFPLYAQMAIRTVNVYDLRTGDFNADGNLDVACATDTITALGTIPRVTVTLGHGDGFFDVGRGFNVQGTNVLSMDVADFDQDGKADAVVTNNESGEIPSMAVLYGNGNGTLGTPLRFGTGMAEGKKALARDFDEDGVPDVAASMAARVAVFQGLCAGAPPANIDVTTPDGGEALIPGMEYTLQWTKGSAVLTVDLQISRDDGANWETIAVDQIGTSFDWTVTPPFTTHARLRVFDSTLNQRSAVSERPFYIGPESAAPEPIAGDTRFNVSTLSPNPSRAGALFRVTVPEPGSLRMLVVDVLGRTLFDQSTSVAGPGPVDLAWDGRTASGSPAPAGVYYVRWDFRDHRATRSVTILR